MPGFLLHKGAAVFCAHTGNAMPTASSPKVLVSQMPVAVMPAPWAVVGCKMPPPPAGNGPCVTALFSMPSLKLTSFGQPLLLTASQAVCAPTATPLIITGSQTRVSGL